MKKMWSLLLILLVPFNVFALEGNVTVNCDEDTVAPGDSITCVMKGNVSGDEVSNVNFRIKTSNADVLSLVEVKKDGGADYWSGGNDDGHVVLYTDTNKTGNFDIVTFTLKASENIVNGSDVKINIYDLSFSGSDYLPVNLVEVDKEIRVASVVDVLQNLKVSDVEISPAFSENAFEYSAKTDRDKIFIEAIPKYQLANISGNIGELDLKYGLNKFEIKVTSEAGTTKVYKINVDRPDNRDADNTLSTLKINGVDIKLDKNKFVYSYDVENNVAEAVVVASLNSKLAVLSEGTLDRKVKLVEGANKVEFKVMAENEKVAVYTLNINRKKKAGLTNPKTGSGTIWIVLGVLVISIVVGICSYEYYKKKVSKNNEEK